MSAPQTERFVPMSELVRLARLVQQMRAAQTTYFRNRQQPDAAELLHAAKGLEQKVDRELRGVITDHNTTPDPFAGDRRGHA